MQTQIKQTINQLIDIKWQRLTGFTLLEIAISLVIIGLILSGSIKIWQISQQVQNRQANEQQLKIALEALIGFALQNGRLPRPAVSAQNGNEMTMPCNNDANCTGFIPWEILAVEKTDSWGKILRYSVSPKYAGGSSGTDSITMSSSGLNANSSIEAKLILTINPANPQLLVRLAHAVPAVVYSQGQRNFGNDISGNTLGTFATNNIDEIANNTGNANGGVAGTSFVFRRNSDENHPRGEFDDQLIWLSPHVLKSRLVAIGRIP